MSLADVTPDCPVPISMADGSLGQTASAAAPSVSPTSDWSNWSGWSSGANTERGVTVA